MITGKIIVLGDLVQVTDTFKKREVVINTGGEYPQTIPVEFVQDKVDSLRGFSVGDQVSISYDLRGREWNNKYFVNVIGWKIDNLEGRQDIHDRGDIKETVDNAHGLSDPQDDMPF